ncbi:hypothetical protein M5G07_12085 [Serratia symbiotica]|nr:hypothetical protein [Serratia symbiotica]
MSGGRSPRAVRNGYHWPSICLVTVIPLPLPTAVLMISVRKSALLCEDTTLRLLAGRILAG